MATLKFKVGDRVQNTIRVNLSGGGLVMKVGTQGVVESITQQGYDVDFGHYGKVRLEDSQLESTEKKP